MKIHRIVIMGKPTPWARVKRGRSGKAYNPKEAEKLAFGAEVLAQYPDSPMKGAVFGHIDFYLPRPKGHFRTGKFSDLLKDNARQRPIAKGRNDIDNLLKFVLDAVQGIIFEDDSQVVSMHSAKHFANCAEPQTRMGFWEDE